MLDEYEQMTGMHCPAAINDKPAELGGSLGDFEATGWGVAACTGKAAEEMNLEPGRTPGVSQGVGAGGSGRGKKVSCMGCPVTAGSDSAGGVENAGGLDIRGLAADVERTGSVAGFPGGRDADKGRILEIPCGILIPAAVQDVITAENALRIQAKVIVEAANAPVSPEADDMLASAGIRVIPDVVANSGGAIVCDFERTQGLSNDYWSLDKVEERLNGRILTAYREAAERVAERKVSMRRGAWINAMGKIRAAMLLRGWC